MIWAAFYTLFLVLAKRKRDLPFPKKTRDALGKALTVFGLEVDIYLAAQALDKEDDMKKA